MPTDADYARENELRAQLRALLDERGWTQEQLGAALLPVGERDKKKIDAMQVWVSRHMRDITPDQEKRHHYRIDEAHKVARALGGRVVVTAVRADDPELADWMTAYEILPSGVRRILLGLARAWEYLTDRERGILEGWSRVAPPPVEQTAAPLVRRGKSRL